MFTGDAEFFTEMTHGEALGILLPQFLQRGAKTVQRVDVKCDVVVFVENTSMNESTNDISLQGLGLRCRDS